MAIVDFFCFCSTVSPCCDTISTEKGYIVFTEKFCIPKKSPFEFQVTESFFKYFTRYRNHFPFKAFVSEVKTPATKESRSNISSKYFSHHQDKAFSPSFVEKSIMKNNYFSHKMLLVRRETPHDIDENIHVSESISRQREATFERAEPRVEISGVSHLSMALSK